MLSSSVSRTWFRSVLSVSVALVAAVALINYVVDSYGIHRTDFTNQSQEPNKNYIKIKYLRDRPTAFDSFIFGSSRVNIIDPKKLKKGVFYNMTYSEGVPGDHLSNIRFMLSHGFRIKNLIIGLDDFSSVVDPGQHLYDLLRQPYYAVSGKSPLTVYGEYYLKLKRFVPSLREYIRFTYLLRPDDPSRMFSYDIYGSGRTLCRTCDQMIENDVAKHVRDPKFDKPLHYEGNNLRGSIESLREIAELARENHITLTVFINPIHRTTYLDADLRQFSSFKRELAKITDFYDFSGLNTVTTNNYYYYETSHYREMVADMMLRKMFGYPVVPVPRDFGVLVTRANIEDHLRTLHRQLRGAPLKHPEKNLLSLRSTQSSSVLAATGHHRIAEF